MTRDYNAACAAVQARLKPEADRRQRMQAVVDILWEQLHPTGVSWVGFYTKVEGGDEMLLGPRRDAPACSPIGLHGACGQALLSARPLVIRDVADLGENYIACDPRDRSEVVVPFCDDGGPVIGVLDLDSHQLAAFDTADIAGLTAVLRCARLA